MQENQVIDPNKQLVLHQHAEDAYLQYAIATVKDRALAQVQDGQKPVQKRILFAMRELGLLSAIKPVKSARVVGDVIGKYHPHGDSAAYDALVRMAQDFTLRYPLITGQGNFGSRDGDSAAAYRYTECKLSPYSELLLAELDQGTVDFQTNFDGSMQEPVLLPSRLPFLLLNGSIGIAVGMASDVPPHNLREVAEAAVAVLEKPQTSVQALMQYIKGPDFPDGGHLISSPEEIQSAYESGRGILRCRARWRKEELARGQWQMVVYELPYQVSAKRILEQIAAITDPKPPQGKKAITAQQAALRQLALDVVENIVDESSKDEKIRIVIHPRTAKVDADAMMTFLLANTSLEDSVSLNMNAIGLDGNPRTKNLKDILVEWGAFRTETVRRRTAHELAQTEKRIHILEGRMTVFLNLDAVIELIRSADDPKSALMTDFSLSETQALDILEMRLRQLNKLEGLKLEKELNELKKIAEKLKNFLANPVAMRKLIIKEIEADAAKYGDDRRTLIQPQQKAAASSAVAKKVSEDPITVVLSKNLWVRARSGHEVDIASLPFKAGDELHTVVKTRGGQLLIALDSKGRAYSVDSAAVPVNGRGDGVPLSTLIDIQEGAHIVALLAGAPTDLYLFAGSQGYGFKAPLSALVARPKAGKAFLTLQPGELPMPPVALSSGEAGYLLCGSAETKLLAFPVSEVKALDKGKGVQLMGLPEGGKLTGLAYVADVPTVLIFESNGLPYEYALRKGDWEKFFGRRARKGGQIPKKALFVGKPGEALPAGAESTS